MFVNKNKIIIQKRKLFTSLNRPIQRLSHAYVLTTVITSLGIAFSIAIVTSIVELT